MIRYLNTFYLEGEKNGVKLQFWLVVKQYTRQLARIGEYILYFGGRDYICFVCEETRLHSCLVSVWFITITERSDSGIL